MSQLSAGRLRRLWQIHRAVRKYGLMEFADGKPRGTRPRGERLREALTELGPVFVKLGQALSTRPDIIPADIAGELAKLQDQVPPFPGDEARAIVERSLGRRIDDVFGEFQTVPMASASVAQVHAARLKPQGEGDPGLEVVVKVLRPGIEHVIRSDIQLLHTLAELAEKFSEDARRIRPRAIVDEYEKVIFDELDLMREGANASLLRRNWLGSELIYHPVVLWDYTRPDVLVMERIHGISIRELDRLRGLGVDFKVLAERGVEIFFKQTFRDNFFHADMHPGNIFVDASNPRKPSYLAVDFGIVGMLTPSDQRYLAENFLAFFNRDYRRVAELHVESEWVPEGTRVEEFEAAIRTICEPIFQRPLKDISFGFFLLRLFQVARRFNYQVQPQLVLLQKTLLNIEGLGRQLYDELDLWKTAKPIMEEWMRNRIGPAAMLEKARAGFPALADTLPQLAHRALLQLERGEGLGGGAGNRRLLLELKEEVRRANRRNVFVLAGSACMVSAALMFGLDGYRPVLAAGVPVWSWAFGLVGALCWLRAFSNRP
ncbi:MAG: ubiquinone biosynthesis regulatory protein kinase UbiB [Nevskiaceae bacterium]|nr:MAG: ubiquinone biosynthesis regulatory protein kinase UbiB [Nevskiaceae bacterium]